MLEDRIYLKVHYLQREEVKKKGAKWDAEKKEWYIPKGYNTNSLEGFIPKKNIETNKTDPQDDFASELEKIGFLLENTHPIMDGKKYRIKTLGDQLRDASGFYMSFTNDGSFGGYAKNHRTGEEVRWFSNNQVVYNKKQREAINSKIEHQRKKLKEEELKLQAETVKKISSLLKSEFLPIDSPTPYHLKKNIEVSFGTYTKTTKDILIVPHHDIDGKICSLTYILSDGTKRYSKNGKKEGCFHVIGGFEELEKVPILAIAEGYSTAATLSKALGFSTIVAFDNGNIMSVAMQLKNKYPNKPIIIYGDDDRHIMPILHCNPGKDKAIAAAKAVGGQAVFPIFTDSEMASVSKNYSDWNDLANNSEISHEEFLRQVKDSLIAK